VLWNPPPSDPEGEAFSALRRVDAPRLRPPSDPYARAVPHAPDVVIDCHIEDVFRFVADFTNALR
jgi:hypothetical protein